MTIDCVFAVGLHAVCVGHMSACGPLAMPVDLVHASELHAAASTACCLEGACSAVGCTLAWWPRAVPIDCMRALGHTREKDLLVLQ